MLLIVGDNDDQMQAINVGGNCVLYSWSTRGVNEEGLVVVGTDLYIADDAGNLWEHSNFDMTVIPSCCPSDPTQCINLPLNTATHADATTDAPTACKYFASLPV